MMMNGRVMMMMNEKATYPNLALRATPPRRCLSGTLRVLARRDCSSLANCVVGLCGWCRLPNRDDEEEPHKTDASNAFRPGYVAPAEERDDGYEPREIFGEHPANLRGYSKSWLWRGVEV
jgi:hypothetical protein